MLGGLVQRGYQMGLSIMAGACVLHQYAGPVVRAHKDVSLSLWTAMHCTPDDRVTHRKEGGLQRAIKSTDLQGCQARASFLRFRHIFTCTCMQYMPLPDLPQCSTSLVMISCN